MCQPFGSNSEQFFVIIWFESSGVMVFINGETQKIESQISSFFHGVCCIFQIGCNPKCCWISKFLNVVSEDTFSLAAASSSVDFFSNIFLVCKCQIVDHIEIQTFCNNKALASLSCPAVLVVKLLPFLIQCSKLSDPVYTSWKLDWDSVTWDKSLVQRMKSLIRYIPVSNFTCLHLSHHMR